MRTISRTVHRSAQWLHAALMTPAEHMLGLLFCKSMQVAGCSIYHHASVLKHTNVCMHVHEHTLSRTQTAKWLHTGLIPPVLRAPSAKKTTTRRPLQVCRRLYIMSVSHRHGDEGGRARDHVHGPQGKPTTTTKRLSAIGKKNQVIPPLITQTEGRC